MKTINSTWLNRLPFLSISVSFDGDDLGILFGVLFALFVLALIFFIVAVTYRKRKDNAEPLMRLEAKVIENNISMGLGGAILSATVLFESSNGGRVRLAIDGDPGLIVGDCGILTYRGKRFIRFEKHS